MTTTSQASAIARETVRNTAVSQARAHGIAREAVYDVLGTQSHVRAHGIAREAVYGVVGSHVRVAMIVRETVMSLPGPGTSHQHNVFVST